MSYSKGAKSWWQFLLAELNSGAAGNLLSHAFLHLRLSVATDAGHVNRAQGTFIVDSFLEFLLHPPLVGHHSPPSNKRCKDESGFDD